MNTDMLAFNLIKELCDNNINFKKIINEGIQSKKIRYFNNEEWDKINSQNYMPHAPELKEFIDMFILGYNIGNCVGTCRQLSYSYDDVDIVSGILPILKGSKNATEVGGHCWLENKTSIIDTSLMLVIDKSLKDKFGYIEEQRITTDDLKNHAGYQARKDFVNDKNLSKKTI